MLGGQLLSSTATTAPLLQDPDLGGALTASQVDSSASNVCVLSKTRRVYCFGDCSTGICGVGLAASQPFWSAPRYAVNLGPYTAQQISASSTSNHVCAIATLNATDTGSVICWGSNDAGQLGLGVSYISASPIIGAVFPAYPAGLVPLPLGVTPGAVAVGARHTCLVAANTSAVYCWGDNNRGQLGVGSIAPRSLASSSTAVALLSNRFAVAVTCGMEHTCVIANNAGGALGDVVCWGRGSEGQLGLGSSADVGTGVTAVGLSVPSITAGVVALQLSAGAFHTCAILGTGGVALGYTGELYCWGANGFGQLGITSLLSSFGAAQAVDTKAQVPLGLYSRAGEVSSGVNHTCATLHERLALCWGSSADQRLGYALNPLLSTPPNVGDNELVSLTGLLDLGPPYRTALHPITAVAGGYWSLALPMQVAVALGHTCVVDGGIFRARCFGLNTNGQLGWGNTNAFGTTATYGNTASKPLSIMPGNRTVVGVAVGSGVSCFLLDNRKVACAGVYTDCRLGLGGAANSSSFSTPQLVDLGYSGTMTAVRLAVGYTHVCAVLANGRVLCWGNNANNALGHTLTAGWICSPNASAYVALGTTAGDASQMPGALVAGNDWSGVIRVSDGAVVTWGVTGLLIKGANVAGYNAAVPGSLPAALGGTRMRHIVAGSGHICAQVEATPTQWTCWGNSNNGQCGFSTANVGFGTTIPYNWWTINAWPGISQSFGFVVLGNHHTIWLGTGANAGFVYCAGSSLKGECVAQAANYQSVQNFAGSTPFIAATTWIAAGEGSSAQHVLFLSNLGQISGWGDNAYNQLGYGATPVFVGNGAHGYIDMGAGVTIGHHLPYVLEARASWKETSSAAAGLSIDVIVARAGPPPGAPWMLRLGPSNTLCAGASASWTGSSVAPSTGFSAGGSPPWDTLRCSLAAASISALSGYPTPNQVSVLSNFNIGVPSWYSPVQNMLLTAPTITGISPRCCAATAGGTIVTVTGTGFGSSPATALAVSFVVTQGTARVALLTSWSSATQVLVTIPPGLGVNKSLVVTISTSGYSTLCAVAAGCYISYSPPTITQVQPSLNVFPGTVINITGYGFGAAGPPSNYSVTIGGVPSPAYWWVSDALIQALVPPNPVLAMPVIVTVEGQVSPGGFTVSGMQPNIVSVYPNASYTDGAALGLTQTFNITGSNMGSNASDITAVSVGGVSCARIVWLSPYFISCQDVPLSAGWTSNSVTVVWGTTSSAANSLFTHYGSPNVTSVQPSSIDLGTFMTISGEWLGILPSDVVLVSIGGSPCTSLVAYMNVGNIPGKTFINCVAPSGAGSAQVTVTIANWPVAVASLAYVNYPANFTMALSWLTPNNEAIAIPSSSPSSPLPFTPLISVKATDASGYPLSLATTCIVSLVPGTATSPTNPAAASSSTLVGGLLTTLRANIDTVASFSTLGAFAAPDTFLNLTVTCTAAGTAGITIQTNLRVYVRAITASLLVSPSPFSVAPSYSRSSIDALTPPPIIQLQASAVFGSSSQMLNLSVARLPALAAIATSTSSTCSVFSLSNAVTAVGFITQAINISTGLATFSNVGLVGGLGVPYQLQFTCMWFTTSLNAVATPASVRGAAPALLDLALSTIPSASLPASHVCGFTSADAGAAYPFIQVAVVPMDPVSGAAGTAPSLPWFSQADITCSLSAVLAADGLTGVALTSSIYRTAPAAIYDPALATINISTGSLRFFPSSVTTTLPAIASLQIFCSFRSNPFIRAFNVSTTIHPPTAAWSPSSTPAMTAAGASTTVVLPSSATALLPALVNVSLSLLDNKGLLLRSDSSTRCMLSASLNASALNPYASVLLTAASGQGVSFVSVLVSGGVAQWAPLALIAPPNSTIDVTALCAPASGDVKISSIVARLYTVAVAVTWRTLGPFWGSASAPASELPTILYKTPYPCSLSLAYYSPLASGALLQPYNTSRIGATSCTLSSADGSLGGGAAALTSSPSDGGIVNYTMLLLAVPDVLTGKASTSISASCLVAGNQISSASLSLTVSSLTLRWLTSPLPFLEYPSSTSNILYIPNSGPLQVAVYDAYNNIVSSDSSSTCSIATSLLQDADNLPLEPIQDPTNTSMILSASGSVANLLPASTMANAITLVAGVGTFPSFGVFAPYNSIVFFQVSCVRSQGDTISPILNATTAIAGLSVAWMVPPPAYTLYNTLTPLAVQLSLIAPNGTLLQPYNSSFAAAGTKCTLSVGTSGDFSPGTISLGGLTSDIVSLVSASGVATFRMYLLGSNAAAAGAASIPIPLAVTCSVLGTNPPRVQAQSQYRYTLFETIVPRWSSSSPPPSFALPSSFGASIPIQPSPLVVFSALSGAQGIDYSSISCSATINARASQMTGAEVPTVVLESSAAANGGYAYSQNLSGVLIEGLTVTSGWNSLAAIDILCTRAEGNALAPLRWDVKIRLPVLEWEVQPPPTFQSRETVSLAIRILDNTTTLQNSSGNLDEVLLLDAGSSVCTLANTPVDTALTPSPGILSGNLATPRNGLALMPTVALSGRPDAEYELTVSCILGSRLFNNSISMLVNLTGCAPAYYPVPPDNTTCGICGSGSYSDGGSSLCTQCPTSAGILCLEGIPLLQQGYYIAGVAQLPPSAFHLPTSSALATPALLLPSNDTAAYLGNTANASAAAAASATATAAKNQLFNLSIEGILVFPTDALVTPPLLIGPDLEIFPCPNAAACFADTASRRFGCAAGYSGVMCTVCRHDLRFAKQGDACIPCLSVAVNYVLLFLAFLLAIAVVLYISLFLKFTEESDARIVWRITINFLTALISLGIFKANGTAEFRSIFNYITTAAAPGSSGSLDIAPVQCELNLGYYTKFYTFMVLPICIAVAAVLINVAKILLASRGEGKTFIKRSLLDFYQSRKWISVAMVVLSLSYPSLTSNAFSIFSCLPYTIGGRSYLSSDLSIYCDDSAHAVAVALSVVSIMMLVVGFPVTFVYYLSRNEARVREGQRDGAFFGGFGFLFAGYKTQHWYEYGYESFVMLRKATIVLIGSVLTDAYMQVLSAQVLITISLLLHLLVMPFTKMELNYVEAAALMTLAFTQAVSLAFLRAEDLRMEQATAAATGVQVKGQLSAVTGLLTKQNTTALLLCINFAMLIALLVFYCKARFADNKRKQAAAASLNFVDKTFTVGFRAVAKGTARLRRTIYSSIAAKQLVKGATAAVSSSTRSIAAGRGHEEDDGITRGVINPLSTAAAVSQGSSSSSSKRPFAPTSTGIRESYRQSPRRSSLAKIATLLRLRGGEEEILQNASFSMQNAALAGSRAASSLPTSSSSSFLHTAPAQFAPSQAPVAPLEYDEEPELHSQVSIAEETDEAQTLGKAEEDAWDEEPADDVDEDEFFE